MNMEVMRRKERSGAVHGRAQYKATAAVDLYEKGGRFYQTKPFLLRFAPEVGDDYLPCREP